MMKFFSSVKLTLLLLLLLAVLSVGGTITPPEAQRYDIFYQSYWFRALLGLLALNIICCTLQELPRKWRYHAQLLKRLQERHGDGVSLGGSFEELRERLSGSGYDLRTEADQLVAVRGGMGRWGAPLVHLAVLLIMLGGVLGETGFVGTINTYLEHPNHRYFDWDVEAERELGFTLRADDFRLRYYPIQLRFELLDAASDRSYGELILYDNESFSVPGTGLTGQLRGFDPEAMLLTIDVVEQGRVLGQYLIGQQLEQFGSARHPAFRLANLQYRDPVLKQYETEVSLLEGGQVVKQGTIRVNEPMSYRGVSIYQTAYGQDEFGNRSVGFQLSRDPGEWLVWSATLLLMFGLTLAFLQPRRVFGIKPVGGQWQLFQLAGWQGDAGREQWQKVLQLLTP